MKVPNLFSLLMFSEPVKRVVTDGSIMGFSKDYINHAEEILSRSDVLLPYWGALATTRGPFMPIPAVPEWDTLYSFSSVKSVLTDEVFPLGYPWALSPPVAWRPRSEVTTCLTHEVGSPWFYCMGNKCFPDKIGALGEQELLIMENSQNAITLALLPELDWVRKTAKFSLLSSGGTGAYQDCLNSSESLGIENYHMALGISRPPRNYLDMLTLMGEHYNFGTSWDHYKLPQHRLVCQDMLLLSSRGVLMNSVFYPVTDYVRGCHKESPTNTREALEQWEPRTIIGETEVQIILSLPKVTLETSGNAMKWNATICDLSISGEIPGSQGFTLPLPVWESCRSMSLLYTAANGSPRSQVVHLPKPQGCDLYDCVGCKNKPSHWCGSPIVKTIYSFIIVCSVFLTLTLLCIVLPWCYSSAKVGAGIFWIMWKFFWVLSFGIRRFFVMISYAGKRCFAKTDSDKSDARNNYLSKMEEGTENKELKLRSIKMSQAARLSRALVLYGLSGEARAASCTSSVGFSVASDFCETDFNGVKTCTTGASGMVSLRGLGEAACLQARNQADLTIAELVIDYKDFYCMADVNLEFVTAAYEYKSWVDHSCHGGSICKDPKCDNSRDKPYPGAASNWPVRHPNIHVECSTFDGCSWNGCGSCNTQCTWYSFTPQLLNTEWFEVYTLGRIQCYSVLEVTGRNLSPESTLSSTLLAGEEKKIGNWVITFLGVFNIDEIWPNYRTLLIDNRGAGYVINDKPGSGLVENALGDLRCPNSTATKDPLLACAAHVKPVITAYHKNKVIFKQANSWVASSKKFFRQLPTEVSGVELALMQDGRVKFKPPKSPTASVSITSASNFSVVIGVGDVCPEAAFLDMNGAIGSTGAALKLRVRAGCTSGWVTLRTNDPDISLMQNTLYITTEWKVVDVFFTSMAREVDFTLALLSLDTSALVDVKGQLAGWDPVIPDPPAEDGAGHTPGGSKSRSWFSFLKSWTFWLSAIGVVALVLLLVKVGFVAWFLSMILSCISTCRKKSNQEIVGDKLGSHKKHRILRKSRDDRSQTEDTKKGLAPTHQDNPLPTRAPSFASSLDHDDIDLCLSN